MSLVGTIRELSVALEEIKTLRSQIGQIKSSFDTLRDRVATLELAQQLKEVEFNHLVERTRSAADAGVSIGIARMEGDMKAKLVELDLRLKAVERATENSSSPKQLPPA